jgi:hypothetical protein
MNRNILLALALMSAGISLRASVGPGPAHETVWPLSTACSRTRWFSATSTATACARVCGGVARGGGPAVDPLPSQDPELVVAAASGHLAVLRGLRATPWRTGALAATVRAARPRWPALASGETGPAHCAGRPPFRLPACSRRRPRPQQQSRWRPARPRHAAWPSPAPARQTLVAALGVEGLLALFDLGPGHAVGLDGHSVAPVHTQQLTVNPLSAVLFDADGDGEPALAVGRTHRPGALPWRRALAGAGWLVGPFGRCGRAAPRQ